MASGANVYMVCRNKERGEAALSKIQEATGSKNVYLEVVVFAMHFMLNEELHCFVLL